ncbi:ABC transporter permease [Auritidibacter ignavus]|uniref:ABC transporter permease n=1 Tax=Auritidibacter ignavus TaxID=678932 RepID=A0AAJ6AJG7_9MICC|nr:ABC transporter permease [Auritidibacter ignavus]WGH85023.1 ABC transporter permease [Auritidibacter ignavus]WGH92048.1 ABC transporter permease [Auritidibacter ignavus]
MLVGIELGLIYALLALGVYLTFRILDFPDLTVDQSFTTGAATAAMMMVHGGSNPLLAMLAAFVVGALAGIITGLLHTKGGINPLLAGILTMLGLYSINLRIMGNQANVPLLGTETIFTWMGPYARTWVSILILLVVVLVIKLILDWFLSTDLGLALQATGNNESMVRSFGVSTDTMKIIGLAVSNGLVGLCGAVVAQSQGSADISMGIGLILVGLASVILGQALFGQRNVFIATTAVVVGSILYRLAIQGALELGLNPNDMRLISALIVIAALLLPKLKIVRRLRRKREINADPLGPVQPMPEYLPSEHTAGTAPRATSQEGHRA